MPKTKKPYAPKDKNGHPLKVGDRVTVQHYSPTKGQMVPLLTNIVGISPSWTWASDKSFRQVECGMLRCMRSAKDRATEWKRDIEVVYAGSGTLITEEEIKKAEGGRKAKLEAARKRRPFKPQVPHLICFVMAQSKKPLTSEEIRRRLHTLQGKQEAFNPSSNTCYFAAGTRGWQADASLINKGYIQRDANYTFSLTEEGKKMAAVYKEWCKS